MSEPTRRTIPVNDRGYLHEITEDTVVDTFGTAPGVDAVHVIDPTSVLAINAALAAQRPLLVRGKPGCGKSRLAWAAAAILDRALVPFTVDARTEPQDLLYRLDDVARLAMAQLQSSRPDAQGVDHAMDVERFVQPGPLWWGFNWNTAERRTNKELRPAGDCRPIRPREDWEPSRGCVVLIDEIDKADPSVPNGLLDALGQRRFDVRQLPPVLMQEPAPLVIIATNEERVVPDAFLRRCLVHHLELPPGRDALVDFLKLRGRAHFPDLDETVLAEAAGAIATDRLPLVAQELAAPGLAEYVDLLRVVRAQRPGDPDAQVKLLKRVQDFALKKHPR